MNPTNGRTRTATLAALFAAGALLQGCKTPDASSFAQLHAGMDQEDVVELLGPPSTRWTAPPPDPGDAAPTWTTRWHYGDTLSTTASAAMGPDIAPDGVWVIQFDGDGKVLDYRIPIPADDTYPQALPPK